MYWFILLFPLLIYPMGPEGPDTYYAKLKVLYLDGFVLIYWLYIIFKRKYWTLEKEKFYLTMEFLILIFISLVGLSTTFSVDKMNSFYGRVFRKEGFVTYFSYCSLLIFSYRFLNINKLKKLLHGIGIVSIFVSFYGILQHYGVDPLRSDGKSIFGSRSSAFFDNPNFFASYLVLVILLTITLLLITNYKKVLLFYFIIIGMSFTALIFSSTRSGWVGLCIGILFLSMVVILKRRYLWKKWVTLLLLLSLIAGVINTFENGVYTNRLNAAVSDSYHVVANKSTGMEGSSRLYIWKKSFPLLKNYFLIGSGPDTFGEIFPAKPDELIKYFGTPNLTVDKAHNEYLQIAVTLGIPALFVYLFLLVAVLRNAYKALKIASGPDQILLYGLISTILGYLAQAYFNISTVPVAPLFWSILGITLAKSSVYLKSKTSYTEKFNQSA
ncbi:O-antigen ligase family protein [Bacillus sp. UNC438CL73TsuS30]|uniref:O-antigen ligase family protein n=1 Tax=Bacillus sp. UNC438CL73TsuS30 TaxID=1340434 RepID=UPI00047A1418|nr:O-antigen ligase family protein [Bacillus sp. UNC438CL73TsuS30]